MVFSLKKTEIVKVLFKLSLIVFTIGFNGSFYAQSNERNQLSNSQKKDAVKLEFLISTISDIYVDRIEEAEKLIEEGLLLAKKINQKLPEATLIYYRGSIESNKSNYSEAIKYYNYSLKIYRKNLNKKNISFCLNSIGITYYDQGELSKAIGFFEESLLIDEELKDFRGVSACYVNIGNIYADQGKYEKAINYYEKAKKIKEEIKDYEGVVKVYTNIGGIYSEQGNYPKALEYLEKALVIVEKPNYKFSSNSLLSSLGTVYKKYGELDKALLYYKKGLKKGRKLKNRKVIAIYLNDIGSIYREQKENTLALSFFKEAIKINQEINNKQGLVASLCNIASIQIEFKKYEKALNNYKKALNISEESGYEIGLFQPYLGIAIVYKKQKKYLKSLYNALKSKRIAEKLNAIEEQKDSYKILSELYSKIEKYEEAYETHKEFKKLNDSIFNKKNIRKIIELEYDYKYKRELEFADYRELKLIKRVKLTSTELTVIQQNFLIGTIVFLLISMFLGYRIFSLKIRNVKSINENILIEQKLLRSQMTPHFMFNSLSVLQGIILKKEYKKAIVYLSKFSSLLRIILENSRYKTVVLAKELKAIESYIAVQNINLDYHSDYSSIIKKNIDITQVLIPPMILQPFVENAIEYAFEESDKSRKIEVVIDVIDKKLKCSIIDNGIGVDEGLKGNEKNMNSGKKSLSTKITAERLKILGKQFKMKTEIIVEDRKFKGEKGTIVTLVMPYRIL